MAVAASVTVVATGTVDAQGLTAVAGRRLLGVSIQESAGTPAVASVILRHGTAATDPQIVFLEFAANESKTFWFGDRGIDASSGVFVDRVAGETVLSLYHTTGA